MKICKKFDRELYDENDSPAKTALIGLLNHIGGKNVTNFRYNEGEGKNGVGEGWWDVECEFKGQKYRFEVETKNKSFWTNNINSPNYPFLYDAMHIPARKEKNKKYVFAFVIFSSDYKFAFVVKTKTLNDFAYELDKKNNKSDGEAETFMAINTSYGRFYEEINEKWKKICRKKLL